jgi:hypothetical protein
MTEFHISRPGGGHRGNEGAAVAGRAAGVCQSLARLKLSKYLPIEEERFDGVQRSSRRVW